MIYNDLTNDEEFLHKLSNSKLKQKFVKILVLTDREEIELGIEGVIKNGSITISGTSTVRRIADLTVQLDNKNNDYNNIDSYLKVNRRLYIYVGEKNLVDESYDDIIWFRQGEYIITSISTSHTTESIEVSLSLEDKMALLNGDCGGVLPTSIIFHEYDQIKSDGTKETLPQKFYDIISTLVNYYGNENSSNIVINDVPLELKNTVRYSGEGELYYNGLTGIFINEQNRITNTGEWITFKNGDNIGYVYTDFTYPEELISGIGDTVSSVLEKITEKLQNHEFFYDLNGKFVFQEKKNYLNTSYINTIIKESNNDLSVINDSNYNVDFSGDNNTIFDFAKNKELITSISSSPNLSNIRNDFHIFGKKKTNNEDEIAIHYHLVIKEKPKVFNKRIVFFNEDGETIRLPKENDSSSKLKEYTPKDWRVELYLQGLEEVQLDRRPDIYQQEIIDNLPSIYNFQKQDFKFDIVKNPTKLNYFIDYLEPNQETQSYCVEAIGSKVYSEEKEEINAIFELDTPNLILLNIDGDFEEYSKNVTKCELQGQPYSNVNKNIYDNISLGSCINTAQGYARQLLFNHTSYNETISISCIPIPYLDINTRIKVEDKESGIYGYYMINSINYPLDIESTMGIECSKIIKNY